VRLIDGEFGPMPLGAIVTEAVSRLPEAVLFGHSGSTSGHPVIAEAAHAIAKVRMVWAACFRHIVGARFSQTRRTSAPSSAARTGDRAEADVGAGNQRIARTPADIAFRDGSNVSLAQRHRRVSLTTTNKL
jgi:hypothetical protein